MKVISGLLPETWDYFCMKHCISTTRNCHSHIHESRRFIVFALLKVHPRFLFPLLAYGFPNSWALGRLPGWSPSKWACLFLLHLYVWLFFWMTWSYDRTITLWLMQQRLTLLNCLVVMWCLFGFWYTGDYLFSGPPRGFWGSRAKENFAPSSKSPNNDTRTKSTTVCHKQD